MIKCAVFDLDGTLVDTITDLGRATDYVLEQMSVKPKWTADDYRSFVGNGARKLIDRAFEHKLSEAQLDEALAIFKIRYKEILLDNAEAYEGIVDALNILKEKGILLAVVTNKPEEAAVLMVKSVFKNDLFDVIIGASEDIPKKPDPYTTNIALHLMDCKPEEAIYFGDSDTDVFTAKNAGITSVACSWGFRSRECLESANPSFIIDSPTDITAFFG